MFQMGIVAIGHGVPAWAVIGGVPRPGVVLENYASGEPDVLLVGILCWRIGVDAVPPWFYWPRRGWNFATSPWWNAKKDPVRSTC